VNRIALLAGLILTLACPALASESSFLRLTGERLRGPVTPSGLTLLGLGTASTLAGEDLERPDYEVRFLEWAPLEPVSDVGNTFGAGQFVLGSSLALWTAGSAFHNERLGDFGRDLTASFVATGAWVWALKMSIGAPRPNGAPYSFPSGHTAVAFATATTLHRHFGRWAGFLGYTAATMTAAARMEDRKHFFRDVSFGAALGMATGGLQLPLRRWFRGFGVDARGVTYSGTF
jgi:membrane-associated phospholipid phosphatase